MAKRIASSSVNWAKLVECTPKYLDPAALQVFKTNTDKHLRRVAANPPEMPKIDWNFYKSKISKPGMVEAFQKGFEAAKIPYPSDHGFLANIDKMEIEAKQDYKKKVEETAKEVSKLEAKLKELKNQLPFSEMCMEEYFVACPENAIDHDNPKIRGAGE